MMESLTNDIVEKARAVIDEVGTPLLHTKAWEFSPFILSFLEPKYAQWNPIIYPESIFRKILTSTAIMVRVLI